MKIRFDYEGDTDYLDLTALGFGKLHQVLRTLYDLSIEDVAEGIGADPYTITRWEKHGVMPSSNLRNELISFYYLLGVPTYLIRGAKD